MSRLRFGGLEAILLAYLLGHSSNVVMTRLVTNGPGTTLGSLAVLPYTLCVSAVLTFLFIWGSGWHRNAHGRQVGRLRLPVPTRLTALSGVGSALMVSAVPMSFSLRDVSIPVILLMLRGGILVLAPVVDLFFGRRIRWWSVVALVTVAIALSLVLFQGGGVKLSALALLTICSYNVGFLMRLTVMTRVAKRGDAAQSRGFFVEEKLVALPLGILGLIGLTLVGIGAPGEGLDGILHVQWTPLLAWQVFGIGATLALVSMLAAMILLGAQENSFCVPLERSSGLLAGFSAAWILHFGWQLPAPTASEMQAAALLLGAILLLTFASRWERRV